VNHKPKKTTGLFRGLVANWCHMTFDKKGGYTNAMMTAPCIFSWGWQWWW